MMNDAILQLLLILAYLAIGLFSITFPIYAICVTYLPQEKWESEKDRKKRIERLRKHIAKLADELSGEPKDTESFKQIKDRIEKHQSEKESLEYLTAKGAVGRPVILLALSLLAAILGIQFLYIGYMELELALICGVFSVMFSVGAVYRLYKTVSSIEYAALRPARTIEFEVYFEPKGKRKKIKLGKETKLEIVAGTIEAALEEVSVMFFLPPEIELKEILTEYTESVKQTPTMDYPNYMMVMNNAVFLHSGRFLTTGLVVLPNKIGKYKIPVSVLAKGITYCQTSLTLDVVK